jgi:hypothetical protein
MMKAPELDADVCGVELGGLSFSGTKGEPILSCAFRPGRIAYPDADRRDNSM